MPPGPGGGNTHAEPAGEFRVGAGHKGSSLFMPNMNEPYPLLLLAESLEDSIDAIAWQDQIWCQRPTRAVVLRVCPMRRSSLSPRQTGPSWLDKRLDARLVAGV